MNNLATRDKWQTLQDGVRLVFTPQAPIGTRRFFVGRVNQITKMIDAIKQPGAHAIVYGERGVGKTSLVTILQELLEGQQLAAFAITKTQCDISDTFQSVFKKLLGNLTVTNNLTVLKSSQGKLPLPDTLDLWLTENPTPDEIRRLILTLGGRHLIAIIDEFDAIAGKREVTNLIANTIKTLSDTLSPSTLILVGISDTVEGLIAEHASIDRCLVEIPVPRMSPEDMRDLIETGVDAIKMSIEEDAMRYICRIAQGLPSYVHLLCRESALVAIREYKTTISKSHAIGGLNSALNLVPGILINDWTNAISSTKTNNLFKQVLFACAFAPKDELGFFNARDVREPIRAITQKPYEIPGYGTSLHLLTDPKRSSILEKRGGSHRWRYRFRNPLMEPYAIMYGLSHQLIDEQIVTAFRRDPLPAIKLLKEG